MPLPTSRLLQPPHPTGIQFSLPSNRCWQKQVPRLVSRTIIIASERELYISTVVLITLIHSVSPPKCKKGRKYERYQEWIGLRISCLNRIVRIGDQDGWIAARLLLAFYEELGLHNQPRHQISQSRLDSTLQLAKLDKPSISHRKGLKSRFNAEIVCADLPWWCW